MWKGNGEGFFDKPAIEEIDDKQDQSFVSLWAVGQIWKWVPSLCDSKLGWGGGLGYGRIWTKTFEWGNSSMVNW